MRYRIITGFMKQACPMVLFRRAGLYLIRYFVYGCNTGLRVARLNVAGSPYFTCASYWLFFDSNSFETVSRYLFSCFRLLVLLSTRFISASPTKASPSSPPLVITMSCHILIEASMAALALLSVMAGAADFNNCCTLI